jgi:hypothetical protein
MRGGDGGGNQLRVSEHDDFDSDQLAPYEIAEALEEASPPGFEGVPAPIVELCQACVEYVKRSVGIELDYEPETLSLVDHYAREVRSTLAGRPEVLPLVGQALGAYFGEVARRALNGFWRLPSPNYHDWQLCGAAAFVAVNPVGVGFDAVVGGEVHEGPRSALRVAPEDRDVVSARLAGLPPVAEDEYFSLCTRLEVLEIVMDALRGEAIRRGYDEVEYGPEDYDAELRPLGMV